MFTLYKKIISPFLHALLLPVTGSSRACVFTPSCSQYTRQAIQSYGIIQGLFKGAKRFFRCHPWSKGGHDPLITKK